MHNMLKFQVNISRIILFRCKKPKEKDKSPIITKHDFYKKKLHLKSTRAHNFQDIFTFFTAGILDHLYVKYVLCIIVLVRAKKNCPVHNYLGSLKMLCP